jgi:hypothetical protein
MSQPDYYAVLGVLPTAPADEITRAWRRLVLAVSASGDVAPPRLLPYRELTPVAP